MSDNRNGNSIHKVVTNWDGIPQDLRNRNIWVGWRGVERINKKGETRLDKVPYMCRDSSRRASSTDPSTWCSYEACKTACELFPESYHGPGIALKAGLLGVDLDHCRDPRTGIVEDWAWEVVQLLSSYTEISPSGTGLKILLYADFTALANALNIAIGDMRNRTDFHDGVIEVYDASSPRYFTITGVRLEHTSEFIEPRQGEFEKLYKRMFNDAINEARAFRVRRKQAEATQAVNNPFGLVAEDDIILDLIRRANNADKFTKLYDEGKWEDFSESDGTPYYASQSEADLGLLVMLGFYSTDEEQLERLFRTSALYRDTKHSAYVSLSVRDAIKKVVAKGEFFDWDYRRQAERLEAQTEYLMSLCSQLGLVPEAPKEDVTVETVKQDEPPINVEKYRDDPLCSYLWEGNHGLLLRDEARARRIRTINKMLDLVPKDGYFRQFLMTYSRGSETAVIYNLASALAVAGHLLNRKVYLPMGDGRISCNCYWGLIGPSTIGRKTSAKNNAKSAIMLVEEYRNTFAPEQFSLSSLLDSFGESIPKKEKKGDPEPVSEDAKAIEMIAKMQSVQEDASVEYLAGVRVFMPDEITSLLREIAKQSNAGLRGLPAHLGTTAPISSARPNTGLRPTWSFVGRARPSWDAAPRKIWRAA